MTTNMIKQTNHYLIRKLQNITLCHEILRHSSMPFNQHMDDNKTILYYKNRSLKINMILNNFDSLEWLRLLNIIKSNRT